MFYNELERLFTIVKPTDYDSIIKVNYSLKYLKLLKQNIANSYGLNNSISTPHLLSEDSKNDLSPPDTPNGNGNDAFPIKLLLSDLNEVFPEKNPNGKYTNLFDEMFYDNSDNENQGEISI